MTVATARACSPFALLDEPLWCVLWHFYQLQERDERRALDDRLVRVDAGILTAHAFNAPDALNDEMRSVRAAIAALDEPPVHEDVAAWRARGDALAARIDAGRVLSPEALAS